MKKIALSGRLEKGKFTLVDDEDFEYLNEYHTFRIIFYTRRSC